MLSLMDFIMIWNKMKCIDTCLYNVRYSLFTRLMCRGPLSTPDYIDLVIVDIIRGEEND